MLDNGLADALTTLAARSAVPVELVTDIPERPSAAIETIAYFSAAELLANVAKHSGARHATLEAVHVPGLLRIRVTDDGHGGAYPGAGRRPARAGRTCPHRRRPPGHRQPGRRPHGGNRRTAVPRLKALVMRIVIAEDAAVIRAGLAEILADRGHEVAAAVGDAEALKAAVAEHKPDVAIVDVRMPPDHTDEGLRAAIAIRRDHPGTGILVFSQYVETRYAADLLRMRSGGVGYLLKDRVANVGEFIDAITRVAAGGTAFDPEVVSGMLNATRHASALAALTARERDVLALMAEGRSNSAIADQLVVSERAVEKHISNIFSKLGLPPSDSDHRRVLAVLAYLGS